MTKIAAKAPKTPKPAKAPKTPKPAKDDRWEEQAPGEFRTWNPDLENENHVLIGTMGAIRVAKTKHGARDIAEILTTEEGEDLDGPWGIDETIDVWVSAGIRALKKIRQGATVKLQPAGYEGRKKLFKVFIKR